MEGKPKASGKQLSSPKQWMFSLKIGVVAVDMRDPRLTEKKYMEKNCAMRRSCCGSMN